MVRVVITSGYRWNYFQWFLLGLYELEKQKKIKLSFKLPFYSALLQHLSHPTLVRIASYLQFKREPDAYNMDGYVVFEDGTRKTFTVDSADSPFLFDETRLKQVDVYFKMQCPKDFAPEGFHLTDEIVIPWSSHCHVDPSLRKVTDRGPRKVISDFRSYQHKIYPLMIGPRQLSRGISYTCLKAGYDNYLKDWNARKEKKVMCYFGNALGPKPEEVALPDYDFEGDLMGYFKGRINHPNEKRARIAEILSQMDGTDARVISQANADKHEEKREDLIIPLEDFCAHISKFEYNVNVSGYRMSIPNRFIESFMVGTAILTDRLHVKWYRPFDTEVVESVEMGYLPMEQVDWAQYQADLNSLPPVDSHKIQAAFQSKWLPEKVAEYMVKTVQNSAE